MQLIKLLTAEFQKNEAIFQIIENFYILLKKENWIKNYIFWELELFKLLGYDLELMNLVDKQIINNQTQYVSKSSTQKKIVPSFLLDKNESFVNLSNLLKGLNLVGDFLDKTILKPKNLNQPINRIEFINSLK